MRDTILSVLLVGSGGFVGAVLRYGLAGAVQNRFPSSSFPSGTLAVNLLGCLVIGALVGLVDARQLFSPDFRKFVLIGLLGAFTTYSTFGYETFAMLRDADYLRALLSVGAHLVFGLVLVWAGYSLATSRWF